MYRTVPYIVLFVILALLQIFLFDNLSISIYLCPLVYIGFIILLPIDAPPVAVLFLALSMSVAMDWAMGAAGINTVATLPVVTSSLDNGHGKNQVFAIHLLGNKP